MGPLAAAVSLGLGALGAAGQVATNRTNIKLSREQMRFQERMSSTAAQRAVRDYRAAGLNPALAYDRTASSPGGVSTTIGDPVSSGINSGRAAAEGIQAMKIARQQSEADLRVKAQAERTGKATEEEAVARGNLLRAQQIQTLNQVRYAEALQPSTVRTANANAILQEAAIPAAHNQAEWEKKLGQLGPGMNSAKTLFMLLRSLRGGR